MNPDPVTETGQYASLGPKNVDSMEPIYLPFKVYIFSARALLGYARNQDRPFGGTKRKRKLSGGLAYRAALTLSFYRLATVGYARRFRKDTLSHRRNVCRMRARFCLARIR